MRARVLFWFVCLAPPAAPAWAGQADDPVTRWHNDHSVYALAFNPDGKSLAAGCLNGAVKVWHVPSGGELLASEGHAGFVNAVAYVDRRRLASAGADRTVRVWDVTTGKPLRTLTGHTDSVRCLAASADGRWLASGGQDEAVILWDVARGAARRKLRQPAAPGSDLGGWQAVRGVAFCAADQALAAVGNDGGVVLWRLDGGKYVRLFPDDTGWADYCLAASADGRMLARGGHRFAAVLQEGGLDATRRLVLLETATGKERARLFEHPGGYTCLSFSPDGRTLAAARAGPLAGEVAVWDLHEGMWRSVRTGHNKAVNAVAFSPDGRLLATGSQDGTVELRTVLSLWGQ